MAIVAFATLGGVALTSTGVSAMPNGMPNANVIVGQTSNVEQARWVCPPGRRCFWRPGWRGSFGFYGPRPSPWKARRHWRRW
jgi:hypothetical protein